MALLAVELAGAGLAALGSKLVLGGEFLRNDGREFLSNVTRSVGDGYARTWDWFTNLSDLQQGPIIVLVVVICAYAFVYGAAYVARHMYGGTLFIDRVPPPQRKIFISDVPPSRYERMDCINPANGEIIGYVAAMDKAEVRRRVNLARDAQKQWEKTSFAERRKVLNYMWTYTVQYQSEIAAICCEESGKTMVDAMLGEILPTCEKFRFVTRDGERWLQPEVRKASPTTMFRRSEVRYYPLGVIGAIQPWNYPFHNFINTVIAGLFAGSAVVVKVSEYAGWSGTYFASIVQEILRQAGHPPELVQVVTGYAEAGEGLIEAGIDKLFFTGSTAVGKQVGRRCGELLVPVELELGGKDAAIVCDDVGIDRVLDIVMRGVFQNAGQNCVGIERILVQERVYDEVVGKLEAKIKELRVGDYRNLVGVADVGAMTMRQGAIFKIQALVNNAVEQGARLLVGGEQNKFVPNGSFYKPTLLVDVTPDMKIAQEETFGPVAVVMKFRDDPECLSIVNGTKYGLGGYIFTADSNRAEFYVRGIRAGMVCVNDYASNYVNQALPFGGTKNSGSGRFAGVEGLRGCCLMKVVSTDRTRFMQTTLPRVLRYPLFENSPQLVKEIIYLQLSRDGLLAKYHTLRQLMLVAWFPELKPIVRPIDEYITSQQEHEAEEVFDDADESQPVVSGPQ